MKRLLIIAALVFAAPFVSLCQTPIRSSSPSLLKETSVESVPLMDTLTDENAGAQSNQAKSADDESGRFWASAEYLLWKMKRSSLPPLIIVGPENSPNVVIGQPGTLIALGGDKLDRSRFPGGRFTAGVWLNEKRNVGIELSYFFLKNRTFNFNVSSSGQPGSQIIARPFFNVITNSEDALNIAIPSARVSGSSAVTSPSQLQGGEANFLYPFNKVHCCRTTFLAGVRYLDLNEQLEITDLADLINVRHFTNTDQFSTRNQFYGGQAGVRSVFNRGRLSLEVSGTLALGNNRQSVEINGATFDSLNLPNNRVGGVLAVISNIGRYRRNQFAVVPEARANLGYRLTHSVRAFIGYDFLYWNNTVRPEEQIDRVVNPNLVPRSGDPIISGPLRPSFTFHSTGFWAQGLTTGVKVRF